MREVNTAWTACFHSGFDSKPYWHNYKCQHLIHNTLIHFSRWTGMEMKPRCSWGWVWNCWKEEDEERRDAKKEVEQKQRKEDGKQGKRNHSYWVLLNKALTERKNNKQCTTFCSKRWLCEAPSEMSRSCAVDRRQYAHLYSYHSPCSIPRHGVWSAPQDE